MQYYQEITLIPQMDMVAHEVWHRLYTQLHLAFVETKDDDGKIIYGVSFPQYRMDKARNVGMLGFKCRVFAPSESDLQALDLGKWLERLTDYLHVSRIRAVPDEVRGYTCYYRAVPKMSVDERIAHQAHRHGVTLDEAKARFKDYEDKSVNHPFIRLTSLSSGNAFSLYIAKKNAESLTAGKFGSYGLSPVASVPEF